MRVTRLWFLMLSTLLVLATSLPAVGQSMFGGSGDFLPVDQAFQYQLQDNKDGTVTLTWNIAPGYYLYQKRMTVEGADGALDRVSYPSGTTIQDEFFGESEVFYKRAEILIETGNATALTLSWQGCAEAGLCYPPQSTTVDFAATPVQASGASADLAEDQSLTQQLADRSLLWSLAIFFGLGILLVFTPCVLPMIPILSAVIVGNHAGRRRAFVLSLAFVVTMAITYALLGVTAAMAGANLQAMLQAPLFIGPLAVIFVALALSMFGLFELQLPAVIRDRLDRVSNRQTGGSLGSAAVMGFISALLASPCMTAPLAGALIFIADTGNTTLGGMALLALGLGMGTPLIILATLGSGLMPKPGAWMNGVKAAFSFLLLGTAIWFLERILDDSLVLALWGALTIALGLAIWNLAYSGKPQPPLRTLTFSAGSVVTFWGALMMIGAAAGGSQPIQPLTELTGTISVKQSEAAPTHARFQEFKTLEDLNSAISEAGATGQWTLVDFYADWCISCKVIDEEVFGDANVVAELSNMQLLRADVTANDAVDQELMRELRVIGPPTILILGPDGQEYRAQRTTGEVSAEQFLSRLRLARQS